MTTVQSIIQTQDSQVLYIPDFLDSKAAELLYHKLSVEIDWQQLPITLFGKKILQPRLTAWCALDGQFYTYSGLTMKVNPMTNSILNLLPLLSQNTGCEYNSVLLNQYRNGLDSMGWHRDNERSLGPQPTIASLSLGATRKFVFRKYSSHGIKHTINLKHGSLLIMSGNMQQDWEHALPKQSKVLEPRINLTFRKIIKKE